MGSKTELEAIEAEVIKNINEGYIDFDGNNCQELHDNDCAGWDMESRRCHCGNRRVYWSTVKLSDGTFEAYAEAY